MANWLSFGAGCHTVWGSVTRGAECTYENRQDQLYSRYRNRDRELYKRSLAEREFILEQSKEIGKWLIAFVLIAVFIKFFFSD